MAVGLDPVIHQEVRLRILAVLYRNRQAAFTRLRDELDLTAGNLASHANRLIEAGYVDSGRVLAGINFEVRYRITDKGNEAFRHYVQSLRALLAVE